MAEGAPEKVPILKVIRSEKVKPSTVRGTPVRSISQGGYTNSGKPPGFQGTVNPQYAGQSATPGGGTPYNSGAGNDDQTKTTKQSGGVGQVIDTQTGTNLNEPSSNGNGVILDGITREGDYFPQSAGAMDSPVPNGSPAFQKGAMRAENIAHLGQGKGADASQAGDVLLGIGGVMDR